MATSSSHAVILLKKLEKLGAISGVLGQLGLLQDDTSTVSPVCNEGGGGDDLQTHLCKHHLIREHDMSYQVLMASYSL